MYFSESLSLEQKRNYFLELISRGHQEAVSYILEHNKIGDAFPAQFQFDCWVSLGNYGHKIWRRLPEIAKILQKHRFDIDVVNEKGYTPLLHLLSLFVAPQSFFDLLRFNCIEFLVDAGASTEAAVQVNEEEIHVQGLLVQFKRNHPEQFALYLKLNPGWFTKLGYVG